MRKFKRGDVVRYDARIGMVTEDQTKGAFINVLWSEDYVSSIDSRMLTLAEDDCTSDSE